MFDIGFSELVVIAVVALVVIGPERLPKVARTAGLLLGRAQRYVSAVRADIDREMQLDDLKKLQAEMQESASAIENGIRGGMQSFDESIRQASQPMSDASPRDDSGAGFVGDKTGNAAPSARK